MGIAWNCCSAFVNRSSCAKAGDAKRQPKNRTARAVFLIMAAYSSRSDFVSELLVNFRLLTLI